MFQTGIDPIFLRERTASAPALSKASLEEKSGEKKKTLN
jgi:hypothetical protein